jgi:predicted RNA-binding Zn ribbon-like protein
VEASDRLNEKARDYEVLAASEVERAPLGATGEHVAAATAFAAVAIALREVASALDEAA